jgi:hypothetical protein
MLKLASVPFQVSNKIFISYFIQDKKRSCDCLLFIYELWPSGGIVILYKSKLHKGIYELQDMSTSNNRILNLREIHLISDWEFKDKIEITIPPLSRFDLLCLFLHFCKILKLASVPFQVSNKIFISYFIQDKKRSSLMYIHFNILYQKTKQKQKVI